MSLSRPPTEGLTEIKGVYVHTYNGTLLCGRLTLNILIHLPKSLGINHGCVYLALSFMASMHQDLHVKVKLAACVFLPQDLDHRCALCFWIVVHSTCTQVDNYFANKTS